MFFHGRLFIIEMFFYAVVIAVIIYRSYLATSTRAEVGPSCDINMKSFIYSSHFVVHRFLRHLNL